MNRNQLSPLTSTRDPRPSEVRSMIREAEEILRLANLSEEEIQSMNFLQKMALAFPDLANELPVPVSVMDVIDPNRTGVPDLSARVLTTKLDNDNKQLAQQYKELSKSNKKLTQENKKLTRNYEKKKKCDDAIKKLVEEKKKLEDQVQALEKEKGDLEKEKGDLEKEKGDLEKKKSDLKAENKELKENKEEENKKMNELESKNKELNERLTKISNQFPIATSQGIAKAGWLKRFKSLFPGTEDLYYQYK